MRLPGLTTAEQQGLILSVGTHRGQRPLSPLEVSNLFEKAIRHGALLSQCAEAVALKGTAMLQRFLRLQSLVPEVRYSVGWGRSAVTIAFSAAWQLADFAPADQVLAYGAILQNQLTAKETEQVLQLAKRSGRPVATCIEDVLRMRPQRETVHVFVGAVTKSRERLISQRQVERDQLLARVIERVYPGVVFQGARLSPEKFTLVTDAAGAKAMASRREGNFEELIDRALSAST